MRMFFVLVFLLIVAACEPIDPPAKTPSPFELERLVWLKDIQLCRDLGGVPTLRLQGMGGYQMLERCDFPFRPTPSGVVK